ncbi:MAG: M48 family metallopeptidase [Verrucomicrobiaceae bacterium]|nr:M48 family metallopeptidase [Verrucomicrobiaceae bacterium]
MPAHRAQGFHQSLPNGRLPGYVAAQGSELRFTSEDASTSVCMPFSGLELKLGGMNGDVPEFRHSSAEGWVLVVNDRALLTDPLLAAQPALRDSLKKAAGSKAWRGMLIAVGVMILLITLPLLALWLYRQEIVESIVNKIPVETEIQIGKMAWEAMKAEEEIIDDPNFKAQVDDVTKLLLPQINKPNGMEFQFHIARKDDVMNAFAMPGGYVVVYTGLLKKVQRKEQLAGVLAHEIAHVTERHALNNIVSSLGVSVLVSALIGDSSTLESVLAGSSEMLLGQKFSRDAETEADDVAWETLVRSNLDPRGLREFFEILQKEEEKLLGGLMKGALSWLSTHPATEERIARLRQKESEHLSR